MHCIPGAKGLPVRALLNQRRGLRAGCGMTGNQYVLPYTLGLPSWAQYLQTVGDAAVFGAQPSVPYFWQPCSTAGHCGFCGAPIAQQWLAPHKGCPGAVFIWVWPPHKRPCLLPRMRLHSQHPSTWSVSPRKCHLRWQALAALVAPTMAIAPAPMITSSKPSPPNNTAATSRLPACRRPIRRPAASTGAHNRAHNRAHVKAHIGAHVGAHLLAYVGAHVGAVVVAHVKAHISAHVGAHVGAHVRAHNFAGRRDAAHQARLVRRGRAGAPHVLPRLHAVHARAWRLTAGAHRINCAQRTCSWSWYARSGPGRGALHRC
jgi:hypothetical protein